MDKCPCEFSQDFMCKYAQEQFRKFFVEIVSKASDLSVKRREYWG